MKKGNLLSGLFAGIISLLTIPGIVLAQDEAEAKKPWTVDTTAGLFSDYMFRGQKLFQGMSIQPEIAAEYDTGYGVLGGNIWMHLPAVSNTDQEKYVEMDDTLQYSYAFEPVTLTAGHIWYTYFNTAEDSAIKNSNEFFVSGSIDMILNPTLAIYYDYVEYDSQYYELGFSHELKDILGENASLTPFVNFGLGSNAKKVYVDNGLEQVTLGVTTEIPFGVITIAPEINYTFKVDDTTVNQLWTGISATYSY